jgi:hypothetical protein
LFIAVFPIALCVVIVDARAEANLHGTLILHTRPGINPTCDEIQYCGRSGITDWCAAIPQTDQIWCVYFWVLAGFPDWEPPPRLAAVSFGVDYDPSNFFVYRFGKCASGTETPGPGWPAPRTGTYVTWNQPSTLLLNEVYWFWGYAYYPHGTFDLIPHPTLGGNFYDDGEPPWVEPIFDYGRFGFGVPGYAPCFPSPPTGVGDPVPSAGGPRLQATPNPFDEFVELRIPELPAGSLTRDPLYIEIASISGRLVWTGAIRQPAGSIRWDGRDMRGRAVPNGTYFARLRQGARRITAETLIRLE